MFQSNHKARRNIRKSLPSLPVTKNSKPISVDTLFSMIDKLDPSHPFKYLHHPVSQALAASMRTLRFEYESLQVKAQKLHLTQAEINQQKRAWFRDTFSFMYASGSFLPIIFVYCHEHLNPFDSDFWLNHLPPHEYAAVQCCMRDWNNAKSHMSGEQFFASVPDDIKKYSNLSNTFETLKAQLTEFSQLLAEEDLNPFEYELLLTAWFKHAFDFLYQKELSPQLFTYFQQHELLGNSAFFWQNQLSDEEQHKLGEYLFKKTGSLTAESTSRQIFFTEAPKHLLFQAELRLKQRFAKPEAVETKQIHTQGMTTSFHTAANTENFQNFGSKSKHTI